MSDYPGGVLFAQAAQQEEQQAALWAEFYSELWLMVGDRAALTVERRGHEFGFTGRVTVHADGSYSIGPDRFVPGTEGILVRWARFSTVRKIRRAYDWSVDGECAP